MTAGKDSASKCFPSQFTMTIVVLGERGRCISAPRRFLNSRGAEAKRHKPIIKSKGNNESTHAAVRSLTLISGTPQAHPANAAFCLAPTPSAGHFQEPNIAVGLPGL